MSGFHPAFLRSALSVLAVLLGLLAAPGAAQQVAPQLREGGYFANLFRFEFKPGKTDEGLEILRDTLVPAYRKSGVQVQVVEAMLGTQDVYLIVALREGPKHYAYVMPPQDADAWRALNELFKGDSAAAEKRLDDFVNLLARQSQELVFINR